MRIAYGIHGYGRGHASRALAVLPELTRRHELLILAGGDAYDALAGEYDVVRIPVLRYVMARGGRRSTRRTLAGAVPSVRGLVFDGPGMRLVRRAMQEFGADVAMSDSEAWTHRAARKLSIPRISFDHYGVLAYCDWPMTAAQRIVRWAEGRVYRWLMGGEPERIVVVSFYAPPPRRDGVRVVGPVLREAVRNAQPVRGDYLLAYFSNGQYHFTPRVEGALASADCPVVIYGVGREGAAGNLDFRPASNTRFIEDLARCRAVFATAGNQLISEAMHFRKPLLLLPEDSLEQRLNVAAIERMRIGMGTSRKRISAEQVRKFLACEPEFAANIPAAVDGSGQAVEAIEQYAAELAGGG